MSSQRSATHHLALTQAQGRRATRDRGEAAGLHRGQGERLGEATRTQEVKAQIDFSDSSLGGALEGPPLARVISPGLPWGDWGTNLSEELFFKSHRGTKTLAGN